MTDEFAVLDATAQAELVRSGQATATQLVDAAIARLETVNPQLNAVIHERFEQARKEAAGDLPDGPFRGVPVVIKDLDGFVAGEPYHGGNKLLKEVGYVAPTDSHLTTKLRQAGLVIVGKTNTPEFGLVPTTEPDAYGPARNPWDLERSTGGSSGGSAAAVASGMVPLGHAGDGGGSIRVPSSECGLVGLKPSRGRHSLGPELGESWGGLVARMLLTRSVRDCATALQAIQGAMPGDPYTAPPPACPYPEEVGADPGSLRIGLCTAPSDPNVVTDPECVAAAENTASLLESLGHTVEVARPESWDDEDYGNAFVGQFINAYAAWTAAEVDRLAVMAGRAVTESDVEPMTWAVAEIGRGITALQYMAAIEFFHSSTRRMAQFWTSEDDGGAGFDLLLTPTMPELPPTLGQFAATPDNPLNGLFRASGLVAFVAPFNVTGQPAMSLPLHWSAGGLPVGVQLVGAYGHEDVLLRVAAQLEAAQPWADRVPPVHA
jgi:amidase